MLQNRIIPCLLGGAPAPTSAQTKGGVSDFQTFCTLGGGWALKTFLYHLKK